MLILSAEVAYLSRDMRVSVLVESANFHATRSLSIVLSLIPSIGKE